MLNTFITTAGETFTRELKQTGHTLITGTSGKGNRSLRSGQNGRLALPAAYSST